MPSQPPPGSDQLRIGLNLAHLMGSLKNLKYMTWNDPDAKCQN